MNFAKNNPVLVGGALIGVGLLAWFLIRGAKGVGKDVGKGAVDLGAGVVEGIGQGFGIPTTDKTQCQKDLDAGNYWDASFSCSAPDLARGIF